MEVNDPEITQIIPLGVRHCSSKEGVFVKISRQDQHNYCKWDWDFIQRAKCTDSPADKQHLRL